MNSLLVKVRLHHQTPYQTTLAQNAPRSYYLWGGKSRLLSQDFDFPSIDPLSARLLWWFGNKRLGLSIGPLSARLLWWFGNKRLGYPPYKGILPNALDSHKKSTTISDWTRMMRHISNGVEATVGTPMPNPQVIAIFKKWLREASIKTTPTAPQSRADKAYHSVETRARG
ncbi:hypothetical protein PHMEG_00014285 [Phytophthora megakarya]|uniref:Uncharacterized protein n=1 Tax=Phytophthora megakarya TaxID=4795 RepID=A0A225W5Q9_9STRA|nr:hypothetical protein PHMEG_00014285 [Phytophthora megakarya]